jgi:hypothetical protein
MQGITFAVPILTTAQMAKQDQIDIVVNQATAAIICCYLEHMNAAIANFAQGEVSSTAVRFIDTTEIVALINSVQGALRTIP